MFTAKDVMALREMSGAGMMDCKKALTACEGDMDKAMDYLREKSLAASAKKAARIAAEGIVSSYVTDDHKVGAIVEVNCETDFVAKTDDFKALVNSVAKLVVEKNPADVDELMALDCGDGTVAEMVSQDRRKDNHSPLCPHGGSAGGYLYPSGRQDRRYRSRQDSGCREGQARRT